MRNEASGALDGIAGGRVAAGKRSRPHVHDAPEALGHTAGEKFTAPDGPVVAIAGPVEAYTDDALIPRFFFREHGGDVRTMMLDGELFRRRHFQRVNSGRILGMQIVDH